MTSNTTLFPVTIVSTDTAALRELSWTLSSFGYQVVASSDWSEDAAWQQTDSPSLLLLDARDQKEIQAELSSSRTTSFVYRIAFHDAIDTADTGQLIDAGIDDLIRYPVVTGELITRLKSGRRRLDFERRFRTTTTLDHRTGMDTNGGFVRQLERQLLNESDSNDGALVVMGVDFLELIYSQHGFFAAENATITLAQRLSDQLNEEDICGHLQEDVFAVLLPGSTVSDGMQFAEVAAREFSEQNGILPEKKNRLSASGVVLNWPSGNSANDGIARGLATLGHVRCCGGNLVLDANEIEQEFSNWQQQLEDDTLRQPITAQHVMESLPLVLPINGSSSFDKHSLRIYAFESGRALPPCVPVVDEKGHLLGVVDPDAFHQYGSDVFQSLGEHLVPVSATVNSSLPLDELFSAMEMVQNDYLVVVDNRKPVGFITSDNLATLATQPLEEQADFEQQQFEESLASLVVPFC